MIQGLVLCVLCHVCGVCAMAGRYQVIRSEALSSTPHGLLLGCEISLMATGPHFQNGGRIPLTPPAVKRRTRGELPPLRSTKLTNLDTLLPPSLPFCSGRRQGANQTNRLGLPRFHTPVTGIWDQMAALPSAACGGQSGGQTAGEEQSHRVSTVSNSSYLGRGRRGWML